MLTTTRRRPALADKSNSERRSEMKHARKLRLGAIMALGAIAAVTFAAAAGAGQVFRETDPRRRHFRARGLLRRQPGMTVDVAFVLDLRVHAVPTAAIVWSTSCNTASGPRCSRIRPTASP